MQNVQLNPLSWRIWRKIQPNQCSILRDSDNVSGFLTGQFWQFNDLPFLMLNFRGGNRQNDYLLILDAACVDGLKVVALAFFLGASASHAIAILTDAVNLDCIKSTLCFTSTGTLVTCAFAINAIAFLTFAHFYLSESRLCFLLYTLPVAKGRQEEQQK